MGYNIEISFNILKNKNVSELEDFLTSLAKDYQCSLSYSIFEMDNTSHIQRNHNVITSIFKEENIKDLVEYIKTIKKMNGIYIECIFNEDTNQIIYASPYYLTIIDKFISNNYHINKRKRSYSEDETMIVDEINKNKK
jgi:site-specific DNA-adenine methylase